MKRESVRQVREQGAHGYLAKPPTGFTTQCHAVICMRRQPLHPTAAELPCWPPRLAQTALMRSRLLAGLSVAGCRLCLGHRAHSCEHAFHVPESTANSAGQPRAPPSPLRALDGTCAAAAASATRHRPSLSSTTAINATAAVRSYHGFASDEEVEHLIDLARPHIRPSEVVDNASGKFFTSK